jgi:hypothetical protein
MSGIISPFGKSGVITDVRGLTIRAYCRITTNNPSSSAFDRSYNVASISYSSSAVNVSFIEPIISPFSITTFYSLATGSSIKFSHTSTQSGSQSSISMSYRIWNNTSTALTNGLLQDLCVAIYGGIGS